jgi:hypothetical protein
VLAGVFKVHNLQQAQRRGLSLFWAHDLDDSPTTSTRQRPNLVTVAAREPTGTIAFQHLGIASALHEHRFAVPPNQRDYAWEDEHVLDLLADLSRAIEGDPPTYFLGTIVLTRGAGERPEVSDGQQRLATVTILLAAIRDYLLELGEERRALHIEQEYLSAIDYDSEESVPKLKLNVDDDEFFRRHVIALPSSPERGMEPTRDSHRRLARAAELAAEHIRKIASVYRTPEHAGIFGRWVSFLHSGAQVILLTVPDHLNAFVMFETLNDRGLRASEADLLKNYLLRQAGNRIEDARNKWARMLAVLESITGNDITVTFLRHVLIAQHGPTKEREIYDRVQTNITGPGRAVAFVTELAESVVTYAALSSPQHAKWNEYDPSVRRSLQTMLQLGVEQIRPLMFAVANKFDPAETAKAFGLFVSWSVRFLIVGGRGGVLDRKYSLAAQQVGTGAITTAQQLADYMADTVPFDSTFQAQFAEARVSQAYLARYYLRTLDYTANRIERPEIEAVNNPTVLNLEHVLPQSPGENWPEVPPEVAEAHYRRLGNLVLLEAHRNTRIGNSSFAEKREHFRGSPLSLTAEVGDEQQWGLPEINKRQERLAELAVEAWPLTIR